MENDTLEKIIKTATLVATCGYQIYQLWKKAETKTKP